jgi:hypothetical protein
LNIIALTAISLSELELVKPDISLKWINENKESFEEMLHSVGLDTTTPYEIQENLPHRNRLNKVVQCSRWLGNERTDKAWIESGYASYAAVDKAKNSNLINDIYRQRGLVE